MLLDRLDYVLAVAEEQNLTRAAARLFVSQPTLTLYLNRLEDDLGVKLFDRTKTPIQLTPAGRYYVEKMKKIFASEQYLRNDLLSIANPMKTFRIGIGQVRGYHWLPTMLSIFCANHPDLNLRIVQGAESHLADELHNDRIDIAFGVMPSSVADMEVLPLNDTEPLILAIPRRFGLIPSDQRQDYSPFAPYLIQPAALEGLPFLMPDLSNGLYNASHSIITENNLHPGRIITINNMTTGLYLAVCGLGVYLIYRSALQQNTVPDIDQLDFCTLEKMPINARCVAAYRPESPKKYWIEEIIELVQDEILPYLTQDVHFVCSS